MMNVMVGSPAKRHGNTAIYGVRNICYHAGPRPEGHVTWYYTRADRDEALIRLRTVAIADGLSVSASRSGLLPVRGRLSILNEDQQTMMGVDGSIRV